MECLRSEIISDQLAFFEDHGWLILRNVVCEEDLIRIVKEFDCVTQRFSNSKVVPCDENGRSIWQVPGICSQNEALLSHIHNGLGKFAADLLGVDRIQLLQDTLIVKPARIGAPIELHQDYTYTGFLDLPNCVSIRLSLTPSTIESGCMYVIDRSHRWGWLESMSVFSDRLQQRVAEQLPSELRARVERDRIPLLLNAGDVSIHHCFTFHGSYENSSDTIQKTIVTHVFDGNCRLIPERLPANAIQLFHTDNQKHLSAEFFPVLFEKLNDES